MNQQRNTNLSTVPRRRVAARLKPLLSTTVAALLIAAGSLGAAAQKPSLEQHEPGANGGLVNSKISKLHRDSQGALWIATEKGIERLASGNLEVLLVGGISPDIVSPFSEDGEGGMFFVTSSGLFHWQKGTARKIPLNISEGDAAVAIYRDPHRRVWIGTRTGVFELISPATNAATEAYKLVPRAQLHSPVSALLSDTAGNLWIGTRSDGLWRLGPDGLTPGSGHEETSPAVPENPDTARSPGSEMPQSSAVKTPARTHLYQTWYFYLGLAVAAILLAIYLFRRRIQLMAGHLGIVLEERNRIASECHDTLMAGFAAISWQLEATAKLFRDSGSENTPAAEACELARSMVSHCQAEARRIIWDLRDTNEVTNVLSQALSRTLSASHIQGAIDTTLDVEGDEIRLAPGCVHHLVCIGQEAVSNAIRHAQCSHIVVHLRYDSDALSLSIRDDGHGFQPSDRSISRR